MDGCVGSEVIGTGPGARFNFGAGQHISHPGSLLLCFIIGQVESGIGEDRFRHRGQGIGVAMRWALIGIIGGLLGYDLYALGAPGALRTSAISERWGALISMTIGSIVAVGGRVLWQLVARWLRERRTEPDG